MNDTPSPDTWQKSGITDGRTAFQTHLTEDGKSAAAKYQEIVIGRRSLALLARYEIITGLFGALPGAPGLFLRRLFYPRLFGRVGRNVVFGKSITIRQPHKIFLGNNVVIDDYAVLDAKGTDNRGIWIGDNVIVGRNTVLSCKNGDILIGDNTNIAMNCFIQSGRRVVIGRYVLFAAYVYVIGGGNHEYHRTDIPIISQGQVVRGIEVGDNSWIGAGVFIQDGVRVGKDAILGTGAVVTRDIPEFGVAAGVPARVIRTRR